MTDGSYAGLDDAAILEQLRRADEGADEPGGESSKSGSGGGRPEGDPEGGDFESCAVGGRAGRGRVGAGMELRVRLSTLLERDEYPAELAGWGPVHAALARDLAITLGGAQWRFVITDKHGQFSHCGITAARPTGAPGRMANCRAIVARRYLQARDRACIMIGCRVPARTADADHTRDHSRRGLTTDDNLGSACRHDHRLKHEGG